MIIIQSICEILSKQTHWVRHGTRWGDYASQLAQERICVALEELEAVTSDKRVWASLLRLLLL